MAAFSARRGGFVGLCVSWRAADGGVGLMGAVGQPIIAAKNSEVFVMDEAARAAGYIVTAAAIPAFGADACVGTDAFCAR